MKKKYFHRAISPLLQQSARSFPLVTLTGPRQSGKTTLLQHLFDDYRYVSLEDPLQLARAQADPVAFLQQPYLIIDEAQKWPELFSYLQVNIDEAPLPGKFILSGSQNFLLMNGIAQSLAGRTVVLELLPLTYQEFCSHPQQQSASPALWQWLYNGSYPRPYQEHLNNQLWFNSYLRTYLERDVRALLAIKDLNRFQQFMQLCAGFHGQLLNMSAIASSCGIAQSTVNEWLSVLEASYLVFRLPPYHRNFKKRIVKTPKLYFYDSAIVCHLLGIDSAEHLQRHSARGAIFEGFVISELIKQSYAQGKRPAIYFWRDHQGLEVDVILEKGETLYSIEIKAGQSIAPDAFNTLQSWQTLSHDISRKLYLVYAGEDSYTFKETQVLGWQALTQIN